MLAPYQFPSLPRNHYLAAPARKETGEASRYQMWYHLSGRHSFGTWRRLRRRKADLPTWPTPAGEPSQHSGVSRVCFGPTLLHLLSIPGLHNQRSNKVVPDLPAGQARARPPTQTRSRPSSRDFRPREIFPNPAPAVSHLEPFPPEHLEGQLASFGCVGPARGEHPARAMMPTAFPLTGQAKAMKPPPFTALLTIHPGIPANPTHCQKVHQEPGPGHLFVNIRRRDSS